MAEVTPENNRKNLDIKCLKCGAFNILENHICGRCGANLPLVFDSEGNISSLKDEPVRLSAAPRLFPRPAGSPIVRAMIYIGVFITLVLFTAIFWRGWFHPLFTTGLLLVFLASLVWLYRNR